MSHFLYKYFPLNNDLHLERIISCIKGYIFFSTPLSFNDPFELATPIEKPSQIDLINFFDARTQQHIHENPPIKKRLTENIQSYWHRQENTLATDEWLRTVGILCTTENPKNLLMWAHYGSNHSGVCLGFDKNSAIFSEAKPVYYTTDRPTLPFTSHKEISDGDIEKIFFTKSKEWNYEKEWRCIKRKIRETEKNYYSELIKSDPDKSDEIADIFIKNGGPGIYDIDSESIRRIYFGCKTKPEHIEKIISAVKSLDMKPKIFSLSLDKRHFDLEENRITL